MFILNDMTKEKEYEAKINEYHKKEIDNKNKLITELEEINQTKDEFLNIASHELRTPMTTIKGYLSMILEGDAGEINDEVKLYLEKIYNSSQRMISLINDMLDLQKLEAGKMQFEIEEVDLPDLLEKVIEDMNQLAKEKDITIYFEKDYDNLIFETDYNKLSQVFVNLINNAIKFTNKGGWIKISSQIEGDWLKTAVIDNGIGISEDKKEKIFEKFGQVKNSFTRNVDGTGLGLPIVNLIVENLGGTIKVESEEDKGSSFIVYLPLKR